MSYPADGVGYRGPQINQDTLPDIILMSEKEKEKMYAPICPITNALPTRMTKKKFKKLCRHHQSLVTARAPNICRDCIIGLHINEGKSFERLPEMEWMK